MAKVWMLSSECLNRSGRFLFKSSTCWWKRLMYCDGSTGRLLSSSILACKTSSLNFISVSCFVLKNTFSISVFLAVVGRWRSLLILRDLGRKFSSFSLLMTFSNLWYLTMFSLYLFLTLFMTLTMSVGMKGRLG